MTTTAAPPCSQVVVAGPSQSSNGAVDPAVDVGPAASPISPIASEAVQAVAVSQKQTTQHPPPLQPVSPSPNLSLTPPTKSARGPNPPSRVVLPHNVVLTEEAAPEHIFTAINWRGAHVTFDKVRSLVMARMRCLYLFAGPPRWSYIWSPLQNTRPCRNAKHEVSKESHRHRGRLRPGRQTRQGS